jgi:S-adenosylmethionine/arginine decarboxylase-like enzyme
MIGLHLIVDGVTDGPVDREVIEGILRELPPRIEMCILAGPVVVRGRPDNPGWTGFVVIDKSHISVHTFDEGIGSASTYSHANPSTPRRSEATSSRNYT